MKKRTNKQNDMPIGRLTRIHDFIPSPDKLIMPEETIKITISLKKSSVDFFKRKAGQYHTKYQKMLRELIDRYATQYAHN